MWDSFLKKTELFGDFYLSQNKCNASILECFLVLLRWSLDLIWRTYDKRLENDIRRGEKTPLLFLAIEHDLIHFSSASLIIIFMAGRKAKKAKKRPSQRVHHLSLGANWKVAPFWREWGYSFSFYGTHTSQLLWVVMGKVCRRSMCPFTMFYFHSTFLVLQKSEYVLRGKKKFRVIFLW